VGFDSCQGQEIFLSLRKSKLTLGLLVQWVLGLFPRGTGTRASSAEVKDE
jgi:hypothetical protein